MARKAIGKKLRFEVFKRDKFQCQYCGEKAPEVVLHVDHVQPVAEGGDNDILNLITSCESCNLGKGARPLDQHQELEKQRDQLEALAERREQLEMLINWREELRSLEQDEVSAVAAAIEHYSSEWTVSDTGRQNLQRWITKFGLDETITAAETSFKQYFQPNADEQGRSDSWSKAFSYIPRIAGVNQRGGLNEEDTQLYYIRGILRNRLAFVNERVCMSLLRDARDAGADVDKMQELAKEVRNWTQWRSTLEEFIEEHPPGGGDGED
ncbi:HNH endonuclease [Parvibaculaceae bacterium PLY_AMNH_Bact1]|nr:HNH endonuclease [Parvibaculaceae bacterium PLY_AMNH_Bact1]